jgi:hypothetical protein
MSSKLTFELNLSDELTSSETVAVIASVCQVLTHVKSDDKVAVTGFNLWSTDDEAKDKIKSLLQNIRQEDGTISVEH